MKYAAVLFTAFLLLSSVVFYGCNRASTEPAAPRPSSSETVVTDHESSEDAHAAPSTSPDMSSGQTDMDKMKAGLAGLSPEDRAAAEKQHVCPVSGKMLGTMGEPYKVEVNGRQVWLCCPGCEGQLREEPDKYLAKLP